MKRTYMSPGGKEIVASSHYHEIIYDCGDGKPM